MGGDVVRRHLRTKDEDDDEDESEALGSFKSSSSSLSSFVLELGNGFGSWESENLQNGRELMP